MLSLTKGNLICALFLFQKSVYRFRYDMKVSMICLLVKTMLIVSFYLQRVYLLIFFQANVLVDMAKKVADILIRKCQSCNVCLALEFSVFDICQCHSDIRAPYSTRTHIIEKKLIKSNQNYIFTQASAAYAYYVYEVFFRY